VAIRLTLIPANQALIHIHTHTAHFAQARAALTPEPTHQIPTLLALPTPHARLALIHVRTIPLHATKARQAVTPEPARHIHAPAATPTRTRTPPVHLISVPKPVNHGAISPALVNVLARVQGTVLFVAFRTRVQTGDLAVFGVARKATLGAASGAVCLRAANAVVVADVAAPVLVVGGFRRGAPEAGLLVAAHLGHADVVDEDLGVVAAEHVVAEFERVGVEVAEVNGLGGVVAVYDAVLDEKARVLHLLFGLVVEARLVRVDLA